MTCSLKNKSLPCPCDQFHQTLSRRCWRASARYHDVCLMNSPYVTYQMGLSYMQVGVVSHALVKLQLNVCSQGMLNPPKTINVTCLLAWCVDALCLWLNGGHAKSSRVHRKMQRWKRRKTLPIQSISQSISLGRAQICLGRLNFGIMRWLSRIHSSIDRPMFLYPAYVHVRMRVRVWTRLP